MKTFRTVTILCLLFSDGKIKIISPSDETKFEQSDEYALEKSIENKALGFYFGKVKQVMKNEKWIDSSPIIQIDEVTYIGNLVKPSYYEEKYPSIFYMTNGGFEMEHAEWLISPEFLFKTSDLRIFNDQSVISIEGVRIKPCVNYAVA